jgi:hypothetical protein
LLPSAAVSKVLGIQRAFLRRGRDEVVAAGLLVQTRAYVPPGGPGSGNKKTQRAAEWDIPHANRGSRPGAPVALDVGDERLPGYWRVMSADLTQFVGVERGNDGKLRQHLTDEQLRVVIALAQGPRTEDGALQEPAKQQVTAHAIVDRLPGLKLRTAQRALLAIEAHGLARKISGGTGSAASIYEPAGLLIAGVPRTQKRKPKGNGR